MFLAHAVSGSDWTVSCSNQHYIDLYWDAIHSISSVNSAEYGNTTSYTIWTNGDHQYMQSELFIAL